MTQISVSEAAGAGFKLIGRRPFSVLTWGLLIILVVYVPLAAVVASVLPQMLDFFGNAMAHPGGPPPIAAMQGLATGIGAFNSLLLAGMLVTGAVVNAAVFRAVLEPENRGFAYLRLGVREVWLMVLYVAEFLLWIVLFGLAAAVVALVSVATAQAAGKGWATLAGLVAGLGLFYLLILTALRLSLAAPMTFAAGEFRLFQSWRVTRGHAGQIFLVCLLLFVILIVAGIVVRVIENIAFLPLRSFVFDPQFLPKARALLARPPMELLRTVWPGLLVVVALTAVYLGLMRSLVAAPWAAVYRMLKPEAAAD